MSSSYTPVPSTEGGRGVSGGVRMRVRPLQVAILLVVGLIVGLPLLAGSERREAVKNYVKSAYHPTMTPIHVPPPSGGIPDEEDVPMTLEARLSHLLARPALDQWEAELPNRYSCPMFTFARNTYFFHDGKDDQWKKINKEDVRRYRRKMVDYLRSLDRDKKKIVWDKSMQDADPANRRGIITTGGGPKDLRRLKLALHMLTNVIKTTLPIEIYYYEGELETPEEREGLLAFKGVELVKSSVPKVHGKVWQIKNRAFIDTKFTQFVYFDSDNIPLDEPNKLFESVEFTQSGSVFWPDLNKDHPDNAIWRILGHMCSDEHWPAESGQVVYDKAANNGLNLAVLHLSYHMMDNDDMYGFLGYGDKDTYRFSFYALGLNYQQAPRMFASVGGYQWSNAQDTDDFCGHSMIQWGLTPPHKKLDTSYHPGPAFLHNILTKHRYGMQPAKLWSHIKRPREDQIQDPRLVRTLYEFTGDCFAIELKGPDGLPDSKNSFGDGQGVLIEPMDEVVNIRSDVAAALKTLAVDFAAINKPGD